MENIIYKDFDSFPTTDKYGVTRWRNEKGQLHRDSGPAVESPHYEQWCQNGICHREDGPAREWASGTKWWYVEGKLHRLDGPAMESANGTKLWFLNGRLHREDGPACEWANGTKSWYLHGKKIDPPTTEQPVAGVWF